MSPLEAVSRVGLNACVLALIAFQPSVLIATPLVLLGIAATAELAVRPYARNGLEKLLLVCGAAVTALILTGVCLNLTPWGLTRGTWALSWILASSIVLIWRHDRSVLIRGRSIKFSLARYWLLSLCALASAGIFVLAGIIAMAGIRAWNQRPILALSLVSQDSHHVVVQINATSTSGTFRIVAEAASGRSQHYYSSPPILLDADTPDQTLYENVPIYASGRWAIYLNAVNGSTHLRELIVDVGK